MEHVEDHADRDEYEHLVAPNDFDPLGGGINGTVCGKRSRKEVTFFGVGEDSQQVKKKGRKRGLRNQKAKAKHTVERAENGTLCL